MDAEAIIPVAIDDAEQIEYFDSSTHAQSNQMQVVDSSCSFDITIPYHFRDIGDTSSQDFLKNTTWIADIKVERHDNLFLQHHRGASNARYNTTEHWTLPLGNALAAAFISDGQIARINANGNISLMALPIHLTGNGPRQIMLHLPSDTEIFDRMFKNENHYYYSEDIRRNLPQQHWIINTSDKGLLLEKVVKMFGSLSSAYDYIREDIWREIFLSEQPNINISKLKKMVNNINENKSKAERSEISRRKVEELKSLRVMGIFISSVDETSKIKSGDLFVMPHEVSSALKVWLQEIWTLGSLQRSCWDGFLYQPQSNIHYSYSNKHPESEIDVICICHGKLVIGELKNDVSMFSIDISKKLIKIAKA